MSHPLIARNADLLALRNLGLNLEICSGHVLIKQVPYVNSKREVRDDGVLVTSLELKAVDGVEKTCPPKQHWTYWIGEHPCHADGSKIRSFENPSEAQSLDENLKVDFMFSAKADYRDYQHKMQAYMGWIIGEAQKLRPDATAQTFPVCATDEDDDDVFNYIDTASSRVGIGADNEKLKGQCIGIVGVGGTGAYILDLVAKTCVEEIRCFDADSFETHNAMRAPGAWSLDELSERKSKVRTHVDIYSKLRRRGLVPHEVALNETNLHLLEGLTFVFLSLDQGKPKRAIVDWLITHNVPFVEVGMGIIRTPTGLQGLIRVTTCTPDKSDHLEKYMSFGQDEVVENEYSTNIQIAELNMLNAALAVIKWKRMLSFYRDAGKEHYTTYQIATGAVHNEEFK